MIVIVQFNPGEAAARRFLDLIAVELLNAHARGSVPEGFLRRQIFRWRGFSEAWTQAQRQRGKQSSEKSASIVFSWRSLLSHSASSAAVR